MSYNLKDLIQQLADRGDELYCVLGTVISVNDEEHTCDVARIDGNADLLGVRLGLGDQPAIKIKPSLNSLVICAMLSKYDACVVMYSQVDNITFYKGDNGGLVKAIELQKQLEYERSRIDSIIKSLSASSDTVSILGTPDQGVSYKAAFETLPTLLKPDYSDIQNTIINH